MIQRLTALPSFLSSLQVPRKEVVMTRCRAAITFSDSIESYQKPVAKRIIYYAEASIASRLFYSAFPSVFPKTMSPLLSVSIVTAATYPLIKAAEHLLSILKAAYNEGRSATELLRDLTPSLNKDYRDSIRPAVLMGLKYGCVGPFIAYLSTIVFPAATFGIIGNEIIAGVFRALVAHHLFAKEANISTSLKNLPNFALMGLCRGTWNGSFKLATWSLLSPANRFLLFVTTRQPLEPFIKTIDAHKLPYILDLIPEKAKVE